MLFSSYPLPKFLCVTKVVNGIDAIEKPKGL